MDGTLDGRQDAEWRFCVDFGTSASKLCVARAPSFQSQAAPQIYPLRVGDFLKGSDTYLAPTAVLFTDDRIRLGQQALRYLETNTADKEPLLSFKKVLGARDVREALEMRLKHSVTDKDYRYKDALVLYIASLLVLGECSLKVQTSLEFDITRAVARYTYPLWRAPAETHQIMLKLFSEASRVAEQVGEYLISPTGVPEEMARKSLRAAELSPLDTMIATGIFEAQAAAEAHTLFGSNLPDDVMVFDMGAGTTDICAFQRRDGTFTEIKSARRTLPMAGDDIDRILLSMFSERAAKSSGASPEAEIRFWRRIASRSRVLKERLFAEGQCEAQFEKRRLVVNVSDLRRDAQFKRLLKQLRDVYLSGLKELAHNMDHKRTIGVVLAGGGAALPPVQELIAKTTARAKVATGVKMMPLVPSWASHPVFEDKLAPVFPQMAIAIGGAMAQLSKQTRPSGLRS